MIPNVFYAFVILILALSDTLIWLRVARLPPGWKRRDQIFAGIVFAFATIVTLNVWLLMRR